MEFKFNLNDFFMQNIVEIGPNLIPPGYSPPDKRALWDTVNKVSEVVNNMGQASATAQGLTKPITTSDRLRNSEQKVYLLLDKNANGGRGAVTGMLKTGKKGLYVFDRDGHHYQVQPACVLDFYIHESKQRMGLGKQLFEHMLEREKVEPVKLAIDRPSDKFLGFLNKHYALDNPVKQMNNFVVFDGFFPEPVGGKTEVSDAPTPKSNQQAANGLQTAFTSYGRYGAPRPPCSMGQIIHNQSPLSHQAQEPNGTSLNIRPAVRKARSCPISQYHTHSPKMNGTESAPDIKYMQKQNKPNAGKQQQQPVGHAGQQFAQNYASQPNIQQGQVQPVFNAYHQQFAQPLDPNQIVNKGAAVQSYQDAVQQHYLQQYAQQMAMQQQQQQQMLQQQQQTLQQQQQQHLLQQQQQIPQEQLQAQMSQPHVPQGQQPIPQTQQHMPQQQQISQAQLQIPQEQQVSQGQQDAQQAAQVQQGQQVPQIAQQQEIPQTQQTPHGQQTAQVQQQAPQSQQIPQMQQQVPHVQQTTQVQQQVPQAQQLTPQAQQQMTADAAKAQAKLAVAEQKVAQVQQEVAQFAQNLPHVAQQLQSYVGLYNLSGQQQQASPQTQLAQSKQYASEAQHQHAHQKYAQQQVQSQVRQQQQIQPQVPQQYHAQTQPHQQGQVQQQMVMPQQHIPATQQWNYAQQPQMGQQRYQMPQPETQKHAIPEKQQYVLQPPYATDEVQQSSIQASVPQIAATQQAVSQHAHYQSVPNIAAGAEHMPQAVHHAQSAVYQQLPMYQQPMQQQYVQPPYEGQVMQTPQYAAKPGYQPATPPPMQTYYTPQGVASMQQQAVYPPVTEALQAASIAQQATPVGGYSSMPNVPTQPVQRVPSGRVNAQTQQVYQQNQVTPAQSIPNAYQAPQVSVQAQPPVQRVPSGRVNAQTQQVYQQNQVAPAQSIPNAYQVPQVSVQAQPPVQRVSSRRDNGLNEQIYLQNQAIPAHGIPNAYQPHPRGPMTMAGSAVGQPQSVPPVEQNMSAQAPQGMEPHVTQANVGNYQYFEHPEAKMEHHHLLPANPLQNAGG